LAEEHHGEKGDERGEESFFLAIGAEHWMRSLKGAKKKATLGEGNGEEEKWGEIRHMECLRERYGEGFEYSNWGGSGATRD